MAGLDDDKKRKQAMVAAPSQYVQEVQNSPGMRALRSIRQGFQDMGARRDTALDNIGASMRGPQPINGGGGSTGVQPPVARPPIAAAPATRLPAVAVRPPARPVAAQVANPAGPAPQAGASAPAGGVPSPDRVVGSVNGRPITQSQADAAGARLPVARGPVVAGPNGSYVASTYPVQGATTQQQNPQPAVAMPTRVAPQADTYLTRQETEARKALMGRLDSMAFANSFAAGRGSKSARNLQGDIVRAMTELTGQGGRAAVDVAGGDREAIARQNITELEQAGATNRTGAEQAGALQRTAMEVGQPKNITDEEGYYLSQSNNIATPVTRADGTAVRAPRAAADGQVTPAAALESLMKEYEIESATAGDTLSTPEVRAQAQQRLQQIGQQVQVLRGGGGAKAVKRTGTAPDGRKVVEYTDGTMAYAD